MNDSTTEQGADRALERGIALVGLAMGVYGAAKMAIHRSRKIEFHNRVVVITGGTRGLGLVLARRFGAEGARLVLASRDQEEIDRAVAELSARRIEVTGISCNVRLKNDVEALIRRAIETYGRIDVLVNNAGVIQVGPMELMTEQDYDEAMDTHFWGPLHAIYAVLPVMRAQGGGRIVNISSIGGAVGVPHLAPYCASKFALNGLSQSLAAELHKDNIYITTVLPNLMRTGSPRNAMFKGQNVKEHRWFALSASLPGISQSAERAAERIVHACRYGQPQLITALPAALFARLHALFPSMSHEFRSAADRFVLPAADGDRSHRMRGHESESMLTRSALTALGRAAARRNNEVLPSQP
jgi:NAD(P)-dependent dehydrogenase (short-subunit alcohol dehydrogenase family)